MSKIKDTDRGFNAFGKRLRKMRKGPHVRAGIQGTEASAEHAGGVTNAMLAAVHEFGSSDGKIPQRSFIRATVDREKSLFDKMLAKAVKSAAATGDIAKELGVVGVKAVAEMRRTIDQSIDLKPLKEKTIARKGSTTPLIDTGTLKGSITYKVQA